MMAEVVEFSKNDDEYFQWLRQNRNGYVINTPRSKLVGYMVLHKADCPSISQYGEGAQPGGFTEREYIKICSNDLRALKIPTHDHGRPDGSFSSECYCTEDNWI